LIFNQYLTLSYLTPTIIDIHEGSVDTNAVYSRRSGNDNFVAFVVNLLICIGLITY